MLYQMLAAAAASYPKHPAIVSSHGALTYEELLGFTEGFACHLTSSGLKAGDTVALLLPNDGDFVIATFALAKMGTIVLPLNPQHRRQEIGFYLQDAAARAIVTTPVHADLCHGILAEVSRECSLITDVKGAARTAPRPGRDSREPIGGDGLCQYSTGSTGTPKRVVRTQANLVHEANNFQATIGTGHNDRILSVAPFFHAHGFGNCALAAVRAGATMVVLESFNRRRVMEMLTKHNITIFPGVPFMFSILADAPSISDTSLPSLRFAFSAGAPLNKDTFDKFARKFGVHIRQLYGSTETGSISTNLGSTEGDLWASVGQPMKNVEVRVVDEQGQEALPGETGEIVVRSDAMTQGYTGAEEANKKSFVNGHFWTEDLGRKDALGNLYLTGRKKFFINVAGNKIDPGEIEAVLRAHPKVQEVVVVGVKGSYGLETIKASVVGKEQCDAQELRDWCQGKIADFKMPRIIEFRDEIPKSPLGKLLRKYLIDEI
jgi:long-chain acyl-CoA synthetase